MLVYDEYGNPFNAWEPVNAHKKWGKYKGPKRVCTCGCKATFFAKFSVTGIVLYHCTKCQNKMIGGRKNVRYNWTRTPKEQCSYDRF